MPSTPDILIIGAGVSGLTAAIELARAGLNVSLLEARKRIGGRVHTLTDPVYHSPIELGAEFIHGYPPEIWNLLQSRNKTIHEVIGDTWCSTEGRLSPCSFFSQVNDLLERMDASGPDESFMSFLQRCCPNSSSDPQQQEVMRRALAYVSGFNAADPNLVGVHWLVSEQRAEDQIEGDRVFRSEHGYADLIEILQDQLNRANVFLQTETVVDAITWAKQSVQVHTRGPQGDADLTTPRALVTLPLSLLQTSAFTEGGVRFIPNLPDSKIEALKQLEMGKVIRITLRFRTRFWDSLSVDRKSLALMIFLLSDDEWFPTWWTTIPEKLPFITGWAPFRCAEMLSGKSDSFVVERSLKSLSAILGVELSALQQQLEAAHFHDWQSDPFSLGAYSYGKVGADGAHAQLASPIDNTLFFAGEATDITGNNGTVHGAIASGRRAAREILACGDTSVNAPR